MITIFLRFLCHVKQLYEDKIKTKAIDDHFMKYQSQYEFYFEYSVASCIASWYTTRATYSAHCAIIILQYKHGRYNSSMHNSILDSCVLK